MSKVYYVLTLLHLMQFSHKCLQLLMLILILCKHQRLTLLLLSGHCILLGLLPVYTKTNKIVNIFLQFKQQGTLFSYS